MHPQKKQHPQIDYALWVVPILAVLLVVALWIVNWFAAPGKDAAESGQFGDKFGAVNALFSGLAFAGIIYTLLLQRKDLKMQRDEMAMQRQEFEQQNFQNIFFGLMKHQQDLRASASAYQFELDFTIDGMEWIESQRLGTGLAAFENIHTETLKIFVAFGFPQHFIWTQDFERIVNKGGVILPGIEENGNDQYRVDLRDAAFTFKTYEISKEQWETARNMQPVDAVRLAYAIAFLRHRDALAPYFQHLYHVLRFLKVTKDQRLDSLQSLPSAERHQKQEAVEQEFYRFARFLQASMSPAELFLCFANALNFEKALDLMVEFSFLDNLDEDATLGIKSGEVRGITFKKASSILDRAMNPGQHYPNP